MPAATIAADATLHAKPLRRINCMKPPLTSLTVFPVESDNVYRFCLTAFTVTHRQKSSHRLRSVLRRVITAATSSGRPHFQAYDDHRCGQNVRRFAQDRSRALNDEPHVSARVRQLVKEAAAKLDYHPNLTAQSLIARRSFLIGLTYERPSPSYVVDLQNGALDRMQSGRYRLIVLPFSRVSERLEELGRLLLSAGLDGFCSRRLRPA
jgi:hypothetical protein